MGKKENMINFDTTNNPVYRNSFKDILVGLGAKLNKETNKWEIENTEKINEYPKLTDLTYVDEKYVTGVNLDSGEIYYDVVLKNIELYKKYNLHPCVFFTHNNKEYCLLDIETKEGKDKATAVEWLYDGSMDFDDRCCGDAVEFDINTVIEGLKA